MSLVVGHVIYKEGSGAANKPKQPVMLAQHYYKAFPLLCAATTSPCLMLVNHHIRSPPKLVRTTLPYLCYTQSTSHTHINPVEATHSSFLLWIPTMYTS